MVEVGTV